jgi:hypothetical protein
MLRYRSLFDDLLRPDVHGAPTCAPSRSSSARTATRSGTPPTPASSSSHHDLMSRRCKDIPADFVDEPQQAVQNADALVAELMQHIAKTLSIERQQLEEHWRQGVRREPAGEPAAIPHLLPAAAVGVTAP